LLYIIDEQFAHDDEGEIYELRNGVWLPFKDAPPPKKKKRKTSTRSKKPTHAPPPPMGRQFPAAPAAPFVPEPHLPGPQAAARAELKRRVDEAARARARRVTHVERALAKTHGTF